MSGASDPPARTAVRLALSYAPLAFLLSVVRVRVQIDDQPAVLTRWREVTIDIAPGPHRIQCWFWWTFWRRAGYAELEVAVPEGVVLPVAYSGPEWGVSRAGSLQLQPAPL